MDCTSVAVRVLLTGQIFVKIDYIRSGLMDNEVTVLGATGYTGQLVVEELQRLRIPFDIAGRSATKLAQLQQRLGLGDDVNQIVADPTQPSTLPNLFQKNTRVLVNCAGPFTRLGEPVVRAAVQAGVHYLDITGEQGFMARVFDQYDLAAQLKNCALIPACGVEYALSNWLAALAAQDLEPLDSILTATNTTGIQTTSGTQLSLLRVLAEAGIGWENGRRVRRLAGSQSRSLKFPSGTYTGVWSPFGETITLPRQFQVKNVGCYMTMPAPFAVSLRVFAPLVPITSQLMSGFFERVLKSGKGPSPTDRSSGRWEILAQAESSRGKRSAILTGNDAYGLTAHIIGYAVGKLLSSEFKGKGALGPAQAFEPRAALEYLGDFGVKFELKVL